jgi:hypothetical protein
MRLGILSFAAVVLCFHAGAQTPTGTIRGSVEDNTGAAVPGVSVEIRNVATGEMKKLVSSDYGQFVQPFLLPGTYEVTVSKQGFQPTRQENIKVDVAQIRDLRFRLEVAAVTENVQVVASTAALDTSSSAVGQVIENKRILDLPLNGRNPFALANLVPGVNPRGTGATPQMGGGRNSVSEVQIDGVTNVAPENNVGINRLVYTPQVDSVEEFSVQINSLAAEYGRFSGGVINVVTKSGTNEFHGTAYEFLRNSKLDANNFFANRAGRERGNFKRHQWGGTIGGPIARNRTFFFAGFEGTNTRNQAVSNNTVPPEQWKRGDFSDLRLANGQAVTIFDPTTVREAPAGSGRFLRDPFPGNRIPANRINAVAENVQKYFPQPNTAPVNPYTFQNNYLAVGTNPSDSYRVDSRADHNFSDKWRTFGRFSVNWSSGRPLNTFNNVASPVGGPSTNRNYNIALDNTYTVSPTTLVNLRYGFGRGANYRGTYSDGFDVTTLGFPRYLLEAAATQALVFPRFDFGGVTSSLGPDTFTVLTNISMVHAVTASVTKIFSRHTVKAGGEYRKLLVNFQQHGQPSSAYSFGRGFTQQEINVANLTQGFPYADFLLGIPGGGSASHEPAVASASTYWAGYIQDDWKVSRRLTLNVGLRYDIDLPRTERFNRYSFWVPQDPSPIAGRVQASAACPSCGSLTGGMRFTDARNRSQVPADADNFGPRFGFSFQATEKTVVRGGYGIAYMPSVMQAAGSTGSAGMQGYRRSTPVQATFDSGRTIVATLSDPFPSGFSFPVGSAEGAATDLGLGIGESFFDNWASGVIQQWNLNIQRELPGGIILEVGYLGNRGYHLPDGDGGRQYNQLPADYMRFGNDLLRVVPNPFAGVITDPISALSRPTVQANQLLRPYPHYTSVNSFRKSNAYSIYHAGTLRVDKRFSNGVSFLAAYTWGKLIDDASSTVGFLGQIAGSRLDHYNRRLEKSISSLDVSHRFVFSGVWEFPVGRGKRFLNSAPRALELIVGGWQSNAIVTLATGVPIFIAGAPNNTGIFSGQRVNNNGRSARITGGTTDERLNRWFDTSVFSLPPPFTFGNVGRILPDVRHAGDRNVDLSLFKNFAVLRDGGLTVQYRLEMFNSFNTPQWGAAGNSIGAGNFGVISSTAESPRQIQMALKLIF